MARILHRRTSLSTSLVEIRYTLSRLRAHPLGAPHIPVFEALRAQCLQGLGQEVELLEEQADAQARVDASDDVLNGLATRFSRTLLNLTGDDRSHPTYTFYFGDTPLADFKRPILGAQLARMAAWIPSLATADPSLQAMQGELTAAVAAGQQAAQAKEAAIQHRREFRDIGPRRALVDRLNSVRKETHGALAGLPHENSLLSSNFADQFFRREQSRVDADADALDSVEAVQARLEELRAEIAAAEARLHEFEVEAENEKKAEEERAANEASLAAIDKAMADLQAQRDALAARL